jgi:hypothetical protein
MSSPGRCAPLPSRRAFAVTGSSPSANSEGTLHALNYEILDRGVPPGGLALTGPPGRSVGTVTRAQLAAKLLAGEPA